MPSTSSDRSNVPVALGLVEVGSVATGIAVADAMVKDAPVASVVSGTVQPGRYLVLVDGDPHSVELAVERGVRRSSDRLVDSLVLAHVDPEVPARLRGAALDDDVETVGVLETASAASAIRGADAGCKGAHVTLLALRVCDGLAGKGLALFAGNQHDVEAALDLATLVARRSTASVETSIVPRLHDEIRAQLVGDLRFGS